jgi:hypothetical protein
VRVRSGGYEVLRSEWRPRRSGRKTPRPPTSLSPRIRGPPRALTLVLVPSGSSELLDERLVHEPVANRERELGLSGVHAHAPGPALRRRLRGRSRRHQSAWSPLPAEVDGSVAALGVAATVAAASYYIDSWFPARENFRARIGARKGQGESPGCGDYLLKCVDARPSQQRASRRRWGSGLSSSARTPGTSTHRRDRVDASPERAPGAHQ